ncbi:hypothetical protein BV20DRAFT_967235, partial [Pilatotrama ljubarskyi]
MLGEKALCSLCWSALAAPQGAPLSGLVWKAPRVRPSLPDADKRLPLGTLVAGVSYSRHVAYRWMESPRTQFGIEQEPAGGMDWSDASRAFWTD